MLSSLLNLVSGGVESCRAAGLEVEAVGIAAAGFILQQDGLLLESPNIAWSMVPLRDLVAKAAGLPVFLENDATAAAAGEHFAGAARGVNDFVYLTMGTGIGGGAFTGGRINRGYRGTAGEFGHMTLDPTGPMCGCGRRGCLEALASGTALRRDAVRLASRDPGSLLYRQCGIDPAAVTGETVSDAAERGDRAALGAFDNVGYYLGLGIVNLVHIFDPEMVVLGGGMAGSGHLLMDNVRRVVAERGISCLVRDVTIIISALGGDAGVIGAAATAWEGIENEPAK
jgi:glucokinase